MSFTSFHTDCQTSPQSVRLLSLMCAGVIMMLLPLAKGHGEDSPQRPQWTTGKITGSPEPPPPYLQVRRFPNLTFDQPLAIENDPTNQRLWVVTRKAKIYSFPDDDDVRQADLFVDLQADYSKLVPLEGSVRTGSAFSIAFHPEYPDVPFCWITYTLKKQDWRQHLDQGTRLSRFRVTFDENGIPRCDVDSERVVLSWLEGGHNGGALRFGPDGYLYVSAGDGEVPNPPDPRRAGQDVTNQLSTILRLDVSTADSGPVYSVPADNPFTKQSLNSSGDQYEVKGQAGSTSDFKASEAMPEIWAYGFRNPWKMDFDSQGRLWVGDVGWELYEMVHNVVKGGNYGWSLFEGPQPLLSKGRRGPTAVLPPALAYHHAEGASVTGGFVYDGEALPELRGQYIFGDYETRRIWASEIIEGNSLGEAKLAGLNDLVEPSVRIVAFGRDTQREPLLIHMDEGTLYGLKPNNTEAKPSIFPTRLSETGLFRDVAQEQPETGVLPFEINEPLFVDNTTADRWIALSGTSPATVLKKGRRRDNSPLRDKIVVETDSVAVRTVSKQDEAGNAVKVETQILHFNGKVWNPYAYVWNAEQTDATLVPDSGMVLDLKTLGNFGRERQYKIHSRSECIRCHNSWVGGLLAFSLPQLNRPVSQAPDGGNQLSLFREIGLLKGAVPKNPAHTDLDHCRALVASSDESNPIQQRARSYLDVNCAHCHQNGAGGTATIDLRFQANLEAAKLIEAAPMQGTFGIEDAKLIAAGHPERSVLLYRLACEGRGHMPHIGSEAVNPAAVQLVMEWILSLKDPQSSSPPDETSAALKSTEGALQLVRLLDSGKIPEQAKAELLRRAREAPEPIRNLLARFQPEEFRSQQRILDRNRILRLIGDPVAGRTVFDSKTLQCAICHQTSGKGGKVGPALDQPQVVKQSKAELLESLMEPSRKIDPKYAAWTVVLKSGKVATGLLTSRTETEVQFVDAKGDATAISASDVEEMEQQRISLMPDRLLDGLTDQQIADLIAWLQSSEK